jgi:hypothetical protein
MIPKMPRQLFSNSMRNAANNDYQILLLLGIIIVFMTPFFILYMMAYPAHDDYAFAAQIRDGHRNWVIDRYMTWSPRPFSDSIIFVVN